MTLRADTRIRTRGGNELAVTRVGHGRPIVVLPGGPGFHGPLYRDYLEPLGEEFGLIFWDYRGCGRSSSAAQYSVQADLDDLRALQYRLALVRPILLGHSYGAILALRYAIDHPEDVGGLVLVCPIASAETFRLAHERRKGRMTEEEYSEWRRLGTLCGEGQAGRDEEVRFLTMEAQNQLYHPGLVPKLVSRLEIRFPVLAAIQADLSTFDVRSRLGEIRSPTLVIGGAHDIVAGEDPRIVHRLIPHSRFVEFGESAHFPFFEEQARFLVEVGEWGREAASA